MKHVFKRVRFPIAMLVGQKPVKDYVWKTNFYLWDANFSLGFQVQQSRHEVHLGEADNKPESSGTIQWKAI